MFSGVPRVIVPLERSVVILQDPHHAHSGMVWMKAIACFVGHTRYYQKFIPGYSTVALPQTDLTKRDCPTKLEWMSECNRAIQQLKRLLCSNPVCS